MTMTVDRRFGAARAAQRLGLTEGQVYTLAIGLVVGLATAAIGIPPTLRDNPELRAALRQGPPADAPGARFSDDSPNAPGVAAPSADSYAAPSVSSGSSVAPSAGVSYGNDEVRAPASGSSSASYADGGKLGDVEKLTTVGSPGAPSGVAVDTDGGFYLATDNGGSLGEPGPSKILHFSASGTLERTYVITGQPDDHARGLSGVALDGAGNLIALDASTAKVLTIDIDSGVQSTLFEVPDVPACTTNQTALCEPSLASAKPIVQGIARMASGDFLVADAGQGIVWKLDGFGGGTIWDKSSDYVSPDIGPSGLAVDTDGTVLLAVSKTVMAGLGGVIYRISPGPEGKAGSHAKVFGTDANTTPNGIAVGASGRIYVAFTGTNTLLVLDRNGAVVQQITSPSFSSPFGLAWRGHSLLLTNNEPAPGDDPSSWSVLRVAAEDTAATG